MVAVEILGIPCKLTEPTLLKAIRVVLGNIAEVAPQDFQRLKCSVTRFVPSSCEDPEVVGFAGGPDPGPVGLRESAGLDSLSAIAVVAHELGHKCTTGKDLEPYRQTFYRYLSGYGRTLWRRVQVPQEPPTLKTKVRDLVADKYASKWGFEEALRHDEPNRKPECFFPPAGQPFELRSPSGQHATFLVTSERELECVSDE